MLHFGHLIEEHELGVGEDLSITLDLVLADLRYYVRRDRSEYRTEYEVFGSSDMNAMTEVLRDIMKPGAHRQVFRSAL